jgi:DNA-binding CsgD family transcriptional regulator
VTPRHEKSVSLPAAILDAFDYGIIVLDKAGQALVVNNKAGQLMQSHDLCHIDGSGTLRSSHTRLEEALRSGRGEGLAEARADLADIGPVTIWIVPLPAGAEAAEADRMVLIMTGGRAIISPGVLAQMLGITSAEARVLHQLMAGKSLIECAHALDLSRNTVRNHLNSVLSKTGAKSQTELLLLIERLVPQLSLCAES